MSPAKCSKLRIAHLTDPQLGFGNEFQGFAANYDADLKRCEKAIELVNAMKPDLSLVTGDMVNVAADLTKDWPRLLEMIQVPVAVAPGHHDRGKSITRENLDRFRILGVPTAAGGSPEEHGRQCGGAHGRIGVIGHLPVVLSGDVDVRVVVIVNTHVLKVGDAVGFTTGGTGGHLVLVTKDDDEGGSVLGILALDEAADGGGATADFVGVVHI